jgi:hypothetical protein
MWSSWSSVAGNLTQNLKQLANDAFEEMSEEEMAAYEKEVAAVRRAEFDLLDPADQACFALFQFIAVLKSITPLYTGGHTRGSFD